MNKTKLDKLSDILNHIKNEQLSHGEHGDAEYIRICDEGIDIIYDIRYRGLDEARNTLTTL